MKLPTSNFKLMAQPIGYSLLTATALLITYSLLGSMRLLKPSTGVNQWQSNIIKIQNYSHQQHLKIDVILVGSSIAANIPAESIGDNNLNLALNGGCSQTGLEAVIRQAVKPKILLVEINNTINRKIDKQIVESNYNPVLYAFHHYLPSFREEYKPSSQLILRLEELRSKLKQGNRLVAQPKNEQQLTTNHRNLTGQILAQAIQDNSKPLSAAEKSILSTEAQYIKSQISKIERDGTQVILFNVPGDSQLENTLAVKQSQVLMKDLFPDRSFDWLPAPPSRQWATDDGVHLIKSDAIIYANFVRERLKISAKSRSGG
jgi:hypothetical protein